MTAWADLADWARKKRVASHCTDGRADADKCNCNGDNCLMAQKAADHFDELTLGD